MAKKTNATKRSLAKPLAWILIISGIVGLFAAGMLTYDKIRIAQNPNFVPACNINPVVSCGSVMKSDQSNAFGFSNPLIGLVAYPVLITVGAAMLAGGKFKRWFWLGLQAGALFGLAFVHWLFYQTVWSIGALCPYCMAVWVITIATFWYMLLYNLETGVIKLPAKLKSAGQFVRQHHLDIFVLWLVVITILIVNHFWYYFGQAFN